MNTNKLDLTIPEVFERASKLDSDKKIQFLRKYDGKSLQWFISSLYNFDWSELEIPEFNLSVLPVGNNFMTIKSAIPKLQAIAKFLSVEPDKRNLKRIEDLMVLVLENVSKDEANLLIRLFTGQRKIEGLSKTVWKKVYPDFFTQVESKQE